MATEEITFNTVEDVKQFADRIEQYPQDVDACCGSCMVDGKSVLGILSLGIRKKPNVVIHNQEGVRRSVTYRPRSRTPPPSCPILFVD